MVMDWLVPVLAAGGLVLAAVLAYLALRRPPPRRKLPQAVKPPHREGQEFTVTPAFMGKVAAAYLAILTAIAGAGMLGYQSVAWFDSGHWPPLSLAEVVRGILGATVNIPAALELVPMGAILLAGALACLAVVFRDND